MQSENNLLTRFQNFLVKQPLFHSWDLDERVLVAVSGGADSMLLLHLLKQSTNWNLIACHTNHHLRGEESNADEQLVNQVCAELSIELHIQNTPTPADLEENTLETQCRQQRRTFQENLMQNLAIKWLATGHQLSDSLETAILNLARGTGVTGLKGIPFQNGNAIHPLLCFTREEVRTLALDLQIPFRDDASNDSLRFRRNQIRHQIIPLLKALNPSLEQTFTQTSGRLSAIDNYLNQVSEVVDTKDFELKELNNPIFPELWSRSSNEDASYANFVDACECGTNLQTGDKLQIGKSTYICNRDRLILVNDATPYQFTFGEFQGWQFKGSFFEIWKMANAGGSLVFDANYLHLEKDQAQNLVLRNWQPGDYLFINQGTAKKKVSDILTDAKVNAAHKTLWPVLVAYPESKEVIWVPGVRINDAYRKNKFENPVSIAFRIN